MLKKEPADGSSKSEYFAAATKAPAKAVTSAKVPTRTARPTRSVGRKTSEVTTKAIKTR